VGIPVVLSKWLGTFISTNHKKTIKRKKKIQLHSLLILFFFRVCIKEREKERKRGRRTRINLIATGKKETNRKEEREYHPDGNGTNKYE